MIKSDSRKIRPQDTFIAIGNGHKYISDAIINGASKIIAEYGNYSVKTKIVDNTQEYLNEYIKKNIYSKIKDLQLIGITGTNGKTTSAYLIYQALNKLDEKCAYIGTIGFYIDDKKYETHNTTPDIMELYDMLMYAKKCNCKYVVMEVSSHALDMNRVYGLNFDFAFFTNLTQDHLDYHKTMENYALAKLKLFKQCRGKKIINIDDKYKDYFLEPDSITYGFNESNYHITDYQILNNKNIFKINNELYESNLLGKYNVYNVAVTIILLKELKLSTSVIKELIAPPGRMQVTNFNDNKIIVDYAHTPDAVKKILTAVKEFKCDNIYTIIGCGGDRDKTKRPIMANIATDLSNYVLFTSDNPRTEEQSSIIKDMINGLKVENYEIENDRELAIKKGIQKLKKNDILMILGKGHEDYQIIGNERFHFDDNEMVKKYTRR